ncbi:MAG: stage III sporulation protein AH [Candidatus Omnitrophota bacterium]
MKKVTIISEPKGDVYSSLLKFALTNCASFSLVWRDQLDFNDSAKNIEEDLKPYLIKEEYTSKWPGTEIFGSKAKVRYYKINPETIKILEKISSLYSWFCPDRPEDLAIYLKSGECWLGSITHEKDAYIYIDKISLEKVKKAIPKLEIK